MADSLFGRLRRRIARWLEPDEHAEPAQPAKTSWPSRVNALAELEERLGQLRDRNLLAGNVQLLGIQRIIDKFGDQWPAYQERIDAICSSIIDRHLSSADFFTPYEDLGYLIIFANLTPDRAQLRCAMIREEIEQRLLGKDHGEHTLDIRTAVFDIDGNIVFKELTSDRELRESVVAIAKQAEAGPGAAAEPAEAVDIMPKPLSDVTCVFRPVWNVNRRVVSTYFCDPARRTANGGVATGAEAIPGRLKADVRLDLDLRLLDRAAEELARLYETGRKLVLAVPVHLNTLGSPAPRDIYLKRCREIPDRLRPLMLFELWGDLGKLPPATVSEVVAKIRASGRAVLGRYDLTTENFEFASGAGIHAVGFDITALGWPERRIMRAMEHFIAKAELAGLHSYVRNVPSISLATAAIAAGARYLDGDAVLSAVDMPDHVYRYDYENLYSGVVARQRERKERSAVPR